MRNFLNLIKEQSLRKKIKVTFALFILSFTSTISSSNKSYAAPGEHGAGFGLGQVIYLGDWSEEVSDGLGINFLYDYDASDIFGLSTSIFYSDHSNPAGTNNVSMLALIPNVKANLAYFDQLTIYALGGFGFYRIDKTIGPQNGSIMTLGFDFGGGFHLRLDQHFKFGTNITFNNVFSKTDPSSNAGGINPLSIGGTYLQLMLNAYYIF